MKVSQLGAAPATVLATLTAALFTGLANAQQPFDLFEQGNRAFADKRYADAAALFIRAHELSPHGLAIHNAGVAWERAGKADAACDAYLAAADFELAPEQAERVTSKLKGLCDQFGRVELSEPKGYSVSVGRLKQVVLPLRFHLEPGTHEIVLRGPQGTKDSTTPIEVEAGKHYQPRLNPVSYEALPLTLKEISFEVSGEVQNNQRLVGYVVLGLGVAAAGAATYFGLEARKTAKEYRRANTQMASTAPGLLNDARDRQLTTNLTWGGAGALGLTGLVLVLTAPSIEF